jgi:hypothetical protein
MTVIRHSTFSANPVFAAQQSSENARDMQEALDRKLTARVVTVARYTATGSTSTKIPLGAGARPVAVLPARIALEGGQADPVVAYGILNFAWDATTGAINVFEPSGLAVDTVYQLSFILVGV